MRPHWSSILLFASISSACGLALNNLDRCRYSFGTGKFVFASLSALDGSWNGTGTVAQNVWIMNTDGSGRTPLTRNTGSVTLTSTLPSLSPDGSLVVFASLTALDGSWNGTPPSSNNIWIMNSDGTNRKPLTHNTAGVLDSLYAQFTPDGTHIVFLSYTALDGSWNGTGVAGPNIWIMNLDGTGRTALTRNTTLANNVHLDLPTFTPDGSKIVFSSLTALNGSWDGTATGSWNVWIMNMDGTNRVALTQNSVASLSSREPQVSPDGKKIAFYSASALDGSWNGTPTAPFNVWTMNIDGSARTPLTFNTTNAAMDIKQANYTLDMKHIVFASATALDGSWNGAAESVNLWIMNPDGTGRTPLTFNTTGTMNVVDFAPMPDNKKISFDSPTALDGTWNGTSAVSPNIWTVNMDGTGFQSLTKNSVTALGSGHTISAVHIPAVCF